MSNTWGSLGSLALAHAVALIVPPVTNPDISYCPLGEGLKAKGWACSIFCMNNTSNDIPDERNSSDHWLDSYSRFNKKV